MCKLAKIIGNLSVLLQLLTSAAVCLMATVVVIGDVGQHRRAKYASMRFFYMLICVCVCVCVVLGVSL